MLFQAGHNHFRKGHGELVASLRDQFASFITLSRPNLKETTSEWNLLFLIWLDGYMACIKDTADIPFVEDLPRLAGNLGHEKLITELAVSNDRPVGLHNISYAEIDERCCELGAPEYVKTDDGEAWYWRFSGSELPVADTLAQLLLAARSLK